MLKHLLEGQGSGMTLRKEVLVGAIFAVSLYFASAGIDSYHFWFNPSSLLVLVMCPTPFYPMTLPEPGSHTEDDP